MTAVSSLLQACWVDLYMSLGESESRVEDENWCCCLKQTHHSNTLGTLGSGQGKNTVDVRRSYKSLCGCVSEADRVQEHFVFHGQKRWD